MVGWWLVWPLLLILLFWLWMLSWWPAGHRWRQGYYPDEPWRPGGGGPWGYHGSWPLGSRPGTQRGKGPAGYQRSESRITEDVNDALTMNDDLDATAILVIVTGGVVTLTGSVSSRGQKRLAEAIADSVPGVRDIKNDLRIEALPPPARTGTGADSSSVNAAGLPSGQAAART